MTYRVAINELGVRDDGTVIEGQTPGDVWRQVAEHLDDRHGIEIPELDDLGGETTLFAPARFNATGVTPQAAPLAGTTEWFDEDHDEETRLIVTRLLEKLQIGQQDSGSSDTVPPTGTRSPMR